MTWLPFLSNLTFHHCPLCIPTQPHWSCCYSMNTSSTPLPLRTLALTFLLPEMFFPQRYSHGLFSTSLGKSLVSDALLDLRIKTASAHPCTVFLSYLSLVMLFVSFICFYSLSPFHGKQSVKSTGISVSSVHCYIFRI